MKIDMSSLTLNDFTTLSDPTNKTHKIRFEYLLPTGIKCVLVPGPITDLYYKQGDLVISGEQFNEIEDALNSVNRQREIADLFAYFIKNPELRFWQGLSNYVSEKLKNNSMIFLDEVDTFYKETII